MLTVQSSAIKRQGPSQGKHRLRPYASTFPSSHLIQRIAAVSGRREARVERCGNGLHVFRCQCQWRRHQQVWSGRSYHRAAFICLLLHPERKDHVCRLGRSIRHAFDGKHQPVTAPYVTNLFMLFFEGALEIKEFGSPRRSVFDHVETPVFGQAGKHCGRSDRVARMGADMADGDVG